MNDSKFVANFCCRLLPVNVAIILVSWPRRGGDSPIPFTGAAGFHSFLKRFSSPFPASCVTQQAPSSSRKLHSHHRMQSTSSDRSMDTRGKHCFPVVRGQEVAAISSDTFSFLSSLSVMSGDRFPVFSLRRNPKGSRAVICVAKTVVFFVTINHWLPGPFRRKAGDSELGIKTLTPQKLIPALILSDGKRIRTLFFHRSNGREEDQGMKRTTG